MKLGIIISQTEAETVWNAFRLGVFSLDQGDEVGVFLLGRGVQVESINHEQFDVPEMMGRFVNAARAILGCGSCLKLRQMGGTETCPVATMEDLHELVRVSDKVLTF